MTDEQNPTTSAPVEPDGGYRKLKAVDDDTEGNRFRGASAPRATEPIEPESGGRFPRVQDDEAPDTQGHERR